MVDHDTKRPTESFGYRPELDGIRALAVLAVMGYHGNVEWLQGGFLGVDLFFVLSGYLITSLLVIEARSTGRVAIGAFWIRRARRLLPALFLVLAWVFVYANVWAEPAETGRLGGDILAALGYVSNWRFVFSGDSYFDQFSAPSPLRHMWSLAIEEQWYVLWPVAFSFLYRARARRFLVGGLLLGAAASVLLMWVLFDPTTDPSRVYYGTDTRLHGLLLGAAVGAAVQQRVGAGLAVESRFDGVVSTLSLGALAGFVVLVDDGDAFMYTGGFAVVAICSVLLIATVSGQQSRNPVRDLFSLQPFTAIGRISYGLYLWHWPLYIVLSPGRTGLDDYGLLGLRVAVTFAVATASFYLVEQPLRHGLRKPSQAAWAVALPIAALAAATFIAIPDDEGEVLAAASPSREPATMVLIGDASAGELVSSLLSSDPAITTALEFIGDPLCVLGQQPGDCQVAPGTVSDALAGSQPEYVVVHPGHSAYLDLQGSTGAVTVGTQEFANNVVADLDAIAAEVGETGRLVLISPGCAPVDTVASFSAASNSWLADLYLGYAASRPTVSAIDLRDVTCTAAGELDAGLFTEEGAQYSDAGADAVWGWMLAELPPPRIDGLSALVVGDSVPFDMVQTFDPGAFGGRLSVIGETRLGCGLIGPSDNAACDDMQRSWGRKLRINEPDFVLLMLSIWDLKEREVDGQLMTFGSETHRDFVLSRLAEMAAEFDDSPSRLVLVGIPCLEPQKTALGADPPVAAEPERVRYINELAEAYVDATGSDDLFIPLGTYTCPTGDYTNDLEGRELHRDGVHFTQASTPLIWEYLISALEADSLRS